jgi:uncharacterized RDD family membrane protein YckC
MDVNQQIVLQAGQHSTSKLIQVRRICAGIIDLLLLTLIQRWIDSIFGFIQDPKSASYVLFGGGLVEDAFPTPAVGLFWLLLTVVAYFFVQEALFSTTLGKSLLGLRVVDINGRRLSVAAAFLRNVLRLVDAGPAYYLIGLAAALTSPSYQRLGDRVAHTYVVFRDSSPFSRFSLTMFWRFAAVGVLVSLVIACGWNFAYYEQPPLVIHDWQIINNTYVFNPQTALPVCGRVDRPFGAYVVGADIDAYHLGSPQWGNGTVTYPISYQLVGGVQLCAGSITLQWQGPFQSGWRISEVKTL